MNWLKKYLPDNISVHSILYPDDHFAETFSITSKGGVKNFSVINKFGHEADSKIEAHSIILASGNLIYFTDWHERLSYEQIQNVFPNLIYNL